MADRHDLAGLSFAAVRSAVNLPAFLIAYRVAGIPENRADACVEAVLEEASHFSILDLASDFHSEAEIFPQVIDAPTEICIK